MSALQGFLLVDKPTGMTSFDIVRQLRRATGCRKIGHGGTLDPLATGVLPIALGRATRLLDSLVNGDKAYRAVLQLGVTTDTLDAEGAVVERRPVGAIDAEQVERACSPFRGRIEQLPPAYSALKHQGRPLYSYARQGEEVPRKPREVEIHQLKVISVTLPEVVIEVSCSKGTYIRTLAQDIGESLGCGAHLIGLRRLQHGPYRLADCTPLADLIGHDWQQGVHPALQETLSLLREIPQLRLNQAAAIRLADGVPPLYGRRG